jgi:hypothetical protein
MDGIHLQRLARLVVFPQFQLLHILLNQLVHCLGNPQLLKEM